MAKKKYDWKKTLEKVGWGVLYALITGAVVIWQDDARYVVVVPLLMAFQNWLKHKVWPAMKV